MRHPDELFRRNAGAEHSNSTARIYRLLAVFYRLVKNMPITQQQQLLLRIPNAGAKAGVFAAVLNTAMQRYQIVGAKRIAAFIAQIGHESGQLLYVREIWGADAYPSQT
jgi:hypothetical protein